VLIAIVIIAIIAGGYLTYQMAVPKQTKTIVIDTWGGNTGDAFKALADKFTQKTGIKVDFVIQGATVAEFEKIQAGTVKVDLWTTIPALATSLAQAGLVASVDSSQVPALSKVPAKLNVLYQGKTIGVAYETLVDGVTVRADLLPNVTINSWQDLWNPAFKGKIGLVAPNRYMAASIVQTALANGGNEMNVSPAFQALKKLAPDIKTIGGTYSQEATAISGGEAPIYETVTATGYGLLQKGINVKFFMPKDAPIFTVTDYLVVLKGSNQNEAMQFLDFFLQPDSQAYYTQAAGTIPVNVDTKVADSFQKYIGISLADLYTRVYLPNATYIQSNLNTWTDTWNNQIQPLIST